MILYPAIDLKDGKCVRLVRGHMEMATVFSDNPAEQAKSFEKQGAKWLHVVDLNGAFEGKPVNMAEVGKIVSSVKIPVQLGGGIRDIAIIEAWLDAGVERLVLGTVALRNPEFVKEVCKMFPEKILVSIDARDGMVAVEGWAEKSDMPVLDLALKFEDAGVKSIIYTNVNHDGMMQGPDIAGIKSLAEKISIPVIASGGVSNHDDLRELKKIEKSGVAGVISGRAIYEGKIDIKTANEILG